MADYKCNDEEAVLLGTWLRGEHIEDIKKVDPSMFQYKEVAEMLGKGYNALRVSRESGIKLAELMSMSICYQPLFYKQVLRSYINKKLGNEIKGLNVDEEGLEKIKELISNQSQLYSQVESDKDITENYIKELNNRAIEEHVLWSKLPSLNRMTHGIKRKQLTTIAGRPASGKSSLALQILLGIAESKQKVLFFPLEMSDNEMIDRILAHKRIIKSEEASSGKLSEDKLNQAVKYLTELEHEGNLKFYEGVRDIESIEEAIRREKPFAVVIDQLSQMRSSEEKFNSIREQFSYMTSNLKAIAMKHNVAVILLCQVNRGAEEQEPTLANLKESGSIEEDSDNVILLYRTPSSKVNISLDWSTSRPMTINLAKQRSGETGIFQLPFKPSEMMFYESVDDYI